MALQLSLNHPLFALQTKIHELTNDFLTSLGFSYFQYLRCFNDGSISLLSNTTKILEFFTEVENQPVVFSSFTNENKNAPSYWFLWDEALPSAPVQLVREKFNFYHGLTLVRRNKNYYDMIAVALPKEQQHVSSFYLNKLKLIENFINQFDKENKEIIHFLNTEKLFLPKAYRDVNYDKICLTQGRVTIESPNGRSYLTVQELACLRLLCQGYAYKEVAQILKLSPRTVETYLNRMKQRTGCLSCHEIEQFLLLCT